MVQFVKLLLATKTFCTRKSTRLCAFSAPGALEHRSTRRAGLHGAVGKSTPTRPRLGVSRCVPSVCGSACTACCIRSARRSPSCSCALSRAPGQTRRPAACRAPGPGILGPGRCGCARFCAPGRSRRPSLLLSMSILRSVVLQHAHFFDTLLCVSPYFLFIP